MVAVLEFKINITNKKFDNNKKKKKNKKKKMINKSLLWEINKNKQDP